MSPALQAHLRLVSQLPSTVHHAKEPKPTNGNMPPAPKDKIQQAAQHEARGMPRRQIAALLGMSEPTIKKYLGYKNPRPR